VQLLKGTAVLATTTTDETGRYALSFREPAGAGALQIMALAECEAPPIRVVDNTDAGAIWAVGAALDGATSTKDLHAAHGWKGTAYDAAARVAAPFAILDTMYGAAKALAAARPAAFPALKVNWSPKNTTSSGDFARGQIGSTCFTPGANEIHVLGKEGVDTDEFDTHVLAHEWGHYFTHNLSRSDNPGGAHAFGEKLDPRMAFDEGAASALSAMLLADARYVDTYWSGSQIVGGSFDLETPPVPTDDPSPGPFSEGSAMRLVYDVYDAGAGEAFDGVGLGLGVVVDVFTGFVKATRADTTIAAFVTGVKQHASATDATRKAVDALLAHYGIGPISDARGAGDTPLSQWFATRGTASASAVNAAASAAPPPTSPPTALPRRAPEAP
jgi:hypothetical protein